MANMTCRRRFETLLIHKLHKKLLWTFCHCLVIKFNQESRLQPCLHTRACEKSYLFCKTKCHMKKMSVKHKTQQQISWGKLQRSMISTVCIDHIWEPMSFQWKWLVNFPLFWCQWAEYLTIRYHPIPLAVWTVVSFLCLKHSFSTKVLVVLKGYCQPSPSKFYSHWLLVSPEETVSPFTVLQ